MGSQGCFGDDRDGATFVRTNIQCGFLLRRHPLRVVPYLLLALAKNITPVRAFTFLVVKSPFPSKRRLAVTLLVPYVAPKPPCCILSTHRYRASLNRNKGILMTATYQFLLNVTSRIVLLACIANCSEAHAQIPQSALDAQKVFQQHCY